MLFGLIKETSLISVGFDLIRETSTDLGKFKLFMSFTKSSDPLRDCHFMDLRILGSTSSHPSILESTSPRVHWSMNPLITSTRARELIIPFGCVSHYYRVLPVAFFIVSVLFGLIKETSEVVILWIYEF